MEEFSKEVLDVEANTARTWTRKPEFKRALREARAQYRSQKGDIFKEAARAKATMVLMSSMARGASTTDQRRAASTILKEFKVTDNALDTVSYSGYTDEQLISEMFKLGLDLPGAELRAFRDVVGLEELT